MLKQYGLTINWKNNNNNMLTYIVLKLIEKIMKKYVNSI